MIVVYTKNNCPACGRMKVALQQKGLDFLTKNIDTDLDAMDEVVALKARAMPVVVKDGVVVDISQL